MVLEFLSTGLGSLKDAVLRQPFPQVGRHLNVESSDRVLEDIKSHIAPLELLLCRLIPRFREAAHNRKVLTRG